MPQFIVPNEEPLQSVKDFLRRRIGISLTEWRKIKRLGLKINGTAASPGRSVVQAGDAISYSLANSFPFKPTLLPADLPLAIVYEDEFLLIADKPAGQLIHPTTKENGQTLANAVLYHYAQHGLPLAFHPVHRLDRNTSGLVLIAKQPVVQHRLSLDGHKGLRRVYLAIVSGTPLPSSGVIDAPIARKEGSIVERTVSSAGQNARTHYRVLSASNTASFAQIELETGRTHQIRVHFAHIGHPLLGDDLYGGPTASICRQALHSASLAFEHPITKESLHFNSPIPKDMMQIIDTFESLQ